MDRHVKQVRNLRKMGSHKLTRLRVELTEMAWDLNDRNQKISDKNIAQTLVLIDRSLVEIEKALGELNSIWLVDRKVSKIRGESLHNYKF